DQCLFAGKIVVHDAFAETELFADLCQRRRTEALAREAFGGGGENRGDARVLPVGRPRRGRFLLVAALDLGTDFCSTVHHRSRRAGRPVTCSTQDSRRTAVSTPECLPLAVLDSRFLLTLPCFVKTLEVLWPNDQPRGKPGRMGANRSNHCRASLPSHRKKIDRGVWSERGGRRCARDY